MLEHQMKSRNPTRSSDLNTGILASEKSSFLFPSVQSDTKILCWVMSDLPKNVFSAVLGFSETFYCLTFFCRAVEFVFLELHSRTCTVQWMRTGVCHTAQLHCCVTACLQNAFSVMLSEQCEASAVLCADASC